MRKTGVPPVMANMRLACRSPRTDRAGSLSALTARDGCLPPLVSKILETCGDAKVAATDELNHCLQIVFLFSRNSNLSILQLALHFETLRLDRLNDFLRFIPFEALLNFQFLPGMSDR